MNTEENTPCAHRLVVLMANIMNYLNVSCYEGRYTYYHQEARKKLNEIYDRVSKTAQCAPSLEDCNDFYVNIHYLRNVMVTDPDYHCYMCELQYLIALYKRTGRPGYEEYEDGDRDEDDERPQEGGDSSFVAESSEEEMEEYDATEEEVTEWWEMEDLLRLERDEWTNQIRSEHYYDE